jgi:hypothetical protein
MSRGRESRKQKIVRKNSASDSSLKKSEPEHQNNSQRGGRVERTPGAPAPAPDGTPGPGPETVVAAFHALVRPM